MKQRISRAYLRSLFVAREMKAGEQCTPLNVRPGDGMHSRRLPEVLGRKAKEGIEAGTPLTAGLVSDLKD